MTPTLISFCDVNNDLRYINLNNVEIIKFTCIPNIMMDKMTVRYKDSEVIHYEIRKSATEILTKKLNTFSV